MLCLHLLQISLVYINTLLIQQLLSDPVWMQKMGPNELRALTPLIYTHVNPYGISSGYGEAVADYGDGQRSRPSARPSPTTGVICPEIRPKQPRFGYELNLLNVGRIWGSGTNPRSYCTSLQLRFNHP